MFLASKTGSTADGHRLFFGQGTWWTTCRRPRQRRTLWIWEAAQDGSPCWWRAGNSKVQHDVLEEWNDNDCETYIIHVPYLKLYIYIYVYKYTLYINILIYIYYMFVHVISISLIQDMYILTWDDQLQCLGCFAQPPAGAFRIQYGCVWKWGIPGSHSQHGNLCCGKMNENEWKCGVLNQYR